MNGRRHSGFNGTSSAFVRAAPELHLMPAKLSDSRGRADEVKRSGGGMRDKLPRGDECRCLREDAALNHFNFSPPPVNWHTEDQIREKK